MRSTATMWRSYVFDLDDTLFPERQYVESGYRAVAQHVAGQTGIDSAVAYQGFVDIAAAGNTANTFDAWIEQNHRLVSLSAAELVDCYREHTPTNIALFDEVPEVFAVLQERRRKIGILTDGNRQVQRRKVKALGVGDLVDGIVFSDDFGREHWKPSQVPYRAILEKLNETPDQAVYVGDNPIKDFFATRQLGMSSVRVKRAGALHFERAALNPAYESDKTISSLRELLKSEI
jgi:putative hydrolase of the HAD superfamily